MVLRRLPEVPRERFGVFLAAEARGAGWTPEALEHAVATGRIVRLRRGVYVAAGLDHDRHPADAARRHRARESIAAALVTTGAVVTGLSAATLFGWPVWAPGERACVNVADSRSTSLVGVHLHRGGLRSNAVAEVAGFRITRPTRTVVDVAREFGTESGLVVADVATRTGATSPQRIAAEVNRLRGRIGVGRARPLADLVDPSAESVLESRSRWQFVIHDLPAPQPQAWLYDLDGNFLGRSDFYWAAGVVGEVDGAEKLTEARARTAHLKRQHLLDRVHLRVTRWGVRDLTDFGATAAWIRDALAAAEADPRPFAWVAEPTRRPGSVTVL